MSASVSCSGRPSSPTTEPPKRWARCSARSAWRLATKIVPAPCSASARAVSSLVSPAPRITTWRSARPPSTLSARSTATEGTLARPVPMAVSERTRLPVVSAAANSRLDSGPVQPARKRGLVRAPDLALDLGLADDHRLQARRHAVELARGVAVAWRVDRFRELGRADLRTLGEQAEHVALGPHRVSDDEVHLGAVARGDHDRLAHLARGERRLRELARLGLGERETLAQRDRRRLVGDPERQQLAHTVSRSRRVARVWCLVRAGRAVGAPQSGSRPRRARLLRARQCSSPQRHAPHGSGGSP